MREHTPAFKRSKTESKLIAKRVFSILTLAAGALAALPSFGAVGIVNGSFESNTANGACATGWTCTNSGNFGEEAVGFRNGQLSGSNLTANSDGGNVLATWNIDSSNAIMQTLTGLSVGSTYTLSFNEASSDRATVAANTGTVGWKVSVNDVVLGTSSVATPGANSSTPWSAETFTFVASATSEVLKFLSESSVPVAPEPLLLLDGVKVQPVAAAVPRALDLGLVGRWLRWHQLHHPSPPK